MAGLTASKPWSVQAARLALALVVAGLAATPAFAQGGGPPAPPPASCGEPLYVDLDSAQVVDLGDVRVSDSASGDPGTWVQQGAPDLTRPMQGPGGGFVFMDTDATGTWTPDDTLLWGPMARLGGTTAYVVLSLGHWPGLTGGYAFGDVLDGQSVGSTLAWPAGSTFRFTDVDSSGFADPGEPVYAVPAGASSIDPGAVHMTPDGSAAPGWVVRPGETDVGRLVIGSFPLRYDDRDSNGFFDMAGCPSATPPPGGGGPTTPTPPSARCGEPIYVDLDPAMVVDVGDVRLSQSIHGLAGTWARTGADDLSLPLVLPSGGFSFMDADGTPGWSTDDTLLWGPLQGVGSATAYVVLSLGQWPGQSGGYPFGTLLDGTAVTGLTPWPTGSTFGFVDADSSGFADPDEAVYALPAGAPDVQPGAVRMTPLGTMAAGWVVRSGDPQQGVGANKPFPLRFIDTTGNAYYDLVDCVAPAAPDPDPDPIVDPTPTTTSALPTPSLPICGEPLYVDFGDRGVVGDTDVRFTSHHGAPGSNADAADGTPPLLHPGGSFVFVDGSLPTGWGPGDTLLWGPMPGTLGTTSSYAVVSPGTWLSGSTMGTVLDVSGVPATSAWPGGSAFRFEDFTPGGFREGNEPVFAVPGSPGTVPPHAVRIAPSSGAGSVIAANDLEVSKVLHPTPFELRYVDTDADGFYSASECTSPDPAGTPGLGMAASASILALAALALRRRKLLL